MDASKIEQSFSLERSFGALKTESDLNQDSTCIDI